VSATAAAPTVAVVLVAALSVAASPAAGKNGVVRGSVTVKGAEPGRRTVVSLAGVIERGGAAPHPPEPPPPLRRSEFGSAASVIAVERAVPTPSAPAIMGQKNLQFVPRLLVVTQGTTVRFENSDPELHNVYSSEGQYDLGTWRRGEAHEHKFETPGAYSQRCRLHPEMLAFVVVLGTPYFAITDAAGRFEIPNVPPGKYTLVVWDHKLDGLERPVTVEKGRVLDLRLVVEH
jgi:plastocyanin